MRNRRAGLGFIFVTLLLDVLGIGLVAPVTPALTTDLLGGNVQGASQYFGWFLACYAAMQFLFAPLLGSLSDRFGRRPVLLLSMLGSGLDYLLLALAPSLSWLFVGRVIAGVTGASITVGVAYIADVSQPEDRAKNFGLMGVAFGLGFILGPALGGLLSVYGLRTPFFAGAVLSLLNLGYGILVLPESLPHAQRRPLSWSRINPVGALAALRRDPLVLGLTGMLVFGSLAVQDIQSVWVLYTTYRYGWDTSSNGIALAMLGVAAVIVQGFVLGPTVKRFGERRTLLIGFAVGALGFTLYGLATHGWMMYVLIGVTSLSNLADPAARALISRRVGADEQGAIQGALMSVASLTSIVAPVVSTALFSYCIGSEAPVVLPGAPFFLAGALAVVGILLARRAFARVPDALPGVEHER